MLRDCAVTTIEAIRWFDGLPAAPPQPAANMENAAKAAAAVVARSGTRVYPA